MELDLFETRTMLEALEQLKPARSFLLDTFFTNVKMHDVKNIDIDIMKGKRRTATYTNPRSEAKVVGRQGYVTRSYTPPYVKHKSPTEAMEAYMRMMGQNIYAGGRTPDDVAAETLAKDLVELDNMIVRLEEVQARDMLHNGSITISGEGIGQTIANDMASDHKLALLTTARWSETSGVDPLKDLRTWKLKIQRDSGLTPTIVVMSEEAYGHFLDRITASSTASPGSKFDMRRVILGELTPKDLNNGVTYVGNLTELQLDIWVYNEWYIDPADGNEKPMMIANSLFMGTPAAYTCRHYGMIMDLDAGGQFMVKRFPKSWRTKDPSVQWVEMQSAPLMMIHQPDAFMRVLVTDT